MEQHSIKVIARIRSDFKTKFGVPRQSGLVEALRARIVFEPEYRNADALRGIEGFSHLWLIWQFSEAVREDWSPTVRPPRLGGNERMGVFATRSPFRPNAIGLSCVRIEGVEQTAEGERRLCAAARQDAGGGLPGGASIARAGGQARCPHRRSRAGPAAALPERSAAYLRHGVCRA